MPRRKTFSLVTVMREKASGSVMERIVSVDITEGLDLEDLTARLAAPTDSAFNVERHVFGGDPIEWSPTVRLGAPRKRKSKPETKPDDKKSGERKGRESKPGTKFTEDGKKAAEQGESNGA